MRTYILSLGCWWFLWWGMWVFPVSADDARKVVVGILLLGLSMCVYVYTRYPRTVFVGIGLIALVWVLVEYFGVTTCLPYGCFGYGELAWPKLLGAFPYTLFLIWPLLVCSVGARWSHSSSLAHNLVLSTSMLVGLDIFLDPVAVHQWVRTYLHGWFWYGVPLSNYLGWVPISLLSVFLLHKYALALVWDVWLRAAWLVFFAQYLVYFFFYVY